MPVCDGPCTGPSAATLLARQKYELEQRLIGQFTPARNAWYQQHTGTGACRREGSTACRALDSQAASYWGYLHFVQLKREAGLPISALDRFALRDPARADALRPDAWGDALVQGLISWPIMGAVGALRGVGEAGAASAATATIARAEGTLRFLPSAAPGLSAALDGLQVSLLNQALAKGGIALNAQIGRVGEQLTAQLLIDSGVEFGRQVTLRLPSGLAARADNIVRIGDDLFILETKTGAAGLTANQAAVSAALEAGEAVTAVGAGAAAVRAAGQQITAKVGYLWWQL